MPSPPRPRRRNAGRSGGLWRVSIGTTVEAEEPVVALLERIFSGRASVYTQAESLHSEVAVYCENPTEINEKNQTALAKGLEELRRWRVIVGPAQVQIKRVPKEDWAESWKRHFRPIEIGRALLIKPSWSRRRARSGQRSVVLDPGLSFGTGQHPTTAFCLRQIARCRPLEGARSFLDIGTGSGILAIAAAKLGYRPVHALDLDVEAVRISRRNARANGVFGKIRISRADLADLAVTGRTYDMICANLTADLLLAEQARIVSRLAPGGLLVLAGILSSQFAEVRRAYERFGLNLTVRGKAGAWESGSFAGFRAG